MGPVFSVGVGSGGLVCVAGGEVHVFDPFYVMLVLLGSGACGGVFICGIDFGVEVSYEEGGGAFCLVECELGVEVGVELLLESGVVGW